MSPSKYEGMLDDELFPKRSTTQAVTTTRAPPKNHHVAENVGKINFSLVKSLPAARVRKQNKARFSKISTTVNLGLVTLIL